MAPGFGPLPPPPHPISVPQKVVGQPLDISDLSCKCNQPGEDQRAVGWAGGRRTGTGGASRSLRLLREGWLGQPLGGRGASSPADICHMKKWLPACGTAQVWRAITRRVQQALEDLEARSPPNVDQV